jgi:cytochrome c oxidase cbb3-type subunit 2
MNNFHTSPRLLLSVPVVVFLGLTAIVAIAPAMEADRVAPADSDPGSRADAVLRGREIYRSEGCHYCHTQQVRRDTRVPETADGAAYPLAQDARYGPASRAEDYAADEPPLLGTARIGPDLMNVGERIPDEAWHLLHLYDPRGLVPDSAMPRFHWLFRGKDDHESGDKRLTLPARMRRAGFEVWATPDAQALAAYLLSLRPANGAR